MGNEKPKPQPLAKKFLANCKATKTHWCPMPSELRRMFLRNRRLITYGRIFEAIWLRTIGKRGLGVLKIETSQQEIANESTTSAGDVARLLAAFKACGLANYQKGWPSVLTINPAMLEPGTLLDFFRAVDFILEAEQESTEVLANHFGDAVRMRMANPTEEPEPEECDREAAR
jgi:hypothetical protein